MEVKKKQCNCEICQDLTEFYSNLQKIPEELRPYFESIYMRLADERTDNEVNKLILKGEWPSSEEYFRANGWIRKPVPVEKPVGDPCPSCEQLSVYAASGGGEKCETEGCKYWFCY